MIAASFGLKPPEFSAMSGREVEIWIEGQIVAWDRFLDALAWVQANLINIHISKGPKLTPAKIRPRRRRRGDPDDFEDDTPAATLEEAKARARAGMDARDAREFEQSEAGRRGRRLLEEKASLVPPDEEEDR